jgi:hypothetical protein
MGALSDKRRAAQRPGKRERARVKKLRRPQAFGTVGGAGHYHVKAGRKKFGKVWAYARARLDSHLGGDSTTLKSGSEIRRPLYTISLASFPGDGQANQ